MMEQQKYYININNLQKTEAKILLSDLKKDIIRYNKAYYQDDNPLITDAEYDYLFNLLKSLEEKFPELVVDDSPTHTVGFASANKFNKVEHGTPMLSLSNGFTNDDIIDFVNRIKKFFNLDYFPEFFCEPKIDGLSFNVKYQNGKLLVASTRGDGYIGEDITDNIKTIDGFPTLIKDAPEIIEVRGEVYIENSDFIALNKMQQNLGLPEFANPRNAAAGSLRQLDPEVTKNRPLKYFIYSIGEVSQKIADTQQHLLQKLSSFGFKVNTLGLLAKNEQEIFSFYQQLNTTRETLPYEIDGVVYKLNDLNLQERIGFIARTPRHSIAHKFPAIIGTTKLLDIALQVGRTGTVTPVAHLEPLSLKGVIVSRATLHNFQEIERKDIRIGDYVFLQRAGDVIPQITAVDYTKRSNEVRKFILPTHCPSCNSELHYDDDEIIVRCDNSLNCLAQNYERLYYFVSKDGLNIVGLGRQQIKTLIDNQLISNPIDIFNLSKHQNLSKLERWGEKSVSNLLANIELAKKVSLSKFITALGIRHIGQETAKLIAEEFVTSKNFIDAVKRLTVGDQAIATRLDDINGIGDKVVKALTEFFSIENNLNILEALDDILTITDYELTKLQSIFTNKTMVFTGNLNSISRAEAKNIAEKLGAKVTNAVTSNTDIVVVGESAGSKLAKAQKLGIQTLTEEEWNESIKNYQ